MFPKTEISENDQEEQNVFQGFSTDLNNRAAVKKDFTFFELNGVKFRRTPNSILMTNFISAFNDRYLTNLDKQKGETLNSAHKNVLNQSQNLFRATQKTNSIVDKMKQDVSQK